MAKLTLTDVTAGFDYTVTDAANNALVEAAVENTLSRDGTAPNTMSADLDLNSNKVTNLTDGTNNQDAISLAQLNAASVVASTIAGSAVTIADSSDYYTATTAEAAVAEIVEDTRYKPSNTSVASSTTPAIDNGFGTWLVRPSQAYTFEVFLKYTQNVGNITWSLVPTGASLSAPAYMVQGFDSSVTVTVAAQAASLLNQSITTTTDTETVNIQIVGSFTAAATTTAVEFRWSQQTSSANNTTVFAGSWIRIKPAM